MPEDSDARDALLTWLTDFDSPVVVEARQRISSRHAPLSGATARRGFTIAIAAVTVITAALAVMT